MIFETPDDVLEHFGVSGMKWGVRRAKRDAVISRVASGKGSALDKARTLARASGHDLVRGRGLQGAAQRKDARNQARAERMRRGESTVRDILVRIGTARFSDIIPASDR